MTTIKETVGELFQNATHHWKINVNIPAIIMAWGLEIVSSVEVMVWVMKNLFSDHIIVGMEYLLEWSWLGKRFDYSECYRNYEEGMQRGRVGFLWWPIRVEKEVYKEKAKVAWTKLVAEIGGFLEESEQRVRGFFINYP